MRSRWCCCFEAAVLVLAVAACIGPAAANTFDPAQVIQALQRQMMAAEAADSAVIPGVRVEEAVLDLGLVEVMEKAGGRLRVPGADFGAEKNEAVKPPLRRRMLVDLARIGDARPAQPDAVAAQAAGSGAMGLASVLADLRSALRPVAEASQDWGLKRLSLDLEFAVDRDPRGAPLLLFFAADRPVNAKNVQKLKLRLIARER